MTVDHPQFGTMCAICFERLTPETCAIDTAGVKWDVCPGQCARQAGVQEVLTARQQEVAARLERLATMASVHGWPVGMAACGCPNSFRGQPPVLHCCRVCGHESGFEVHTACKGCEYNRERGAGDGESRG